MRKRIFVGLLAVAVLVLALSSVISAAYLHSEYNRELSQRLSVELSLAAKAVNEAGADYLVGAGDGSLRFTLVAADGTVVYDTRAQAQTMENHGGREEIREALETGHGSGARYSATLTEKTLYEAVRLENGGVLRIAANQQTVGGAIMRVLPMNLIIGLLALLAAAAISHRISRAITAPLLALDLEHPMENRVYEELAPVLGKIHSQHRQIRAQMEELRHKNEEFRQILSSMNEGLVLLDAQGRVVAMNRAARGIFAVETPPEGKDFLLVDRTPELSKAIRSQRHSDKTLEKNGRQYQLTVSPIEADGSPAGTLLLAFDVTEKAFAERNRQEFTANVSHELKTPLQGIIGSAELLENGLVKPEDTGRFVSNIKKEAARLVRLIDDIIRLSQLDEGAGLASEPVELSALAGEVAEALTPSGEKRKVTLRLQCQKVTVRGVRRYLYEILYNLCDNAIRYNREGGSVELAVRGEGRGAVLTVTDTGIGIAPEHQGRIFERFYRVDKSHSKETGGTGLGLAIVKRAVMLHGGRLELRSDLRRGTVITVWLPGGI